MKQYVQQYCFLYRKRLYLLVGRGSSVVGVYEAIHMRVLRNISSPLNRSVFGLHAGYFSNPRTPVGHGHLLLDVPALFVSVPPIRRSRSA